MSDPVAGYSEVLAARRGELHAIEGVTGSGVGLSDSGDVVIQLFVRSHEDVENVRHAAAALLGHIPLDVVVSGDVTAADVKGGVGDG